MAAKYRKLDPRIWHDEKFQTLSPQHKLIAVYCLTCSDCNRIGLFHLSLARAAEETGYPSDTLAKGMAYVCHTLGWGFERVSSTLFLPTWWKYNGACGPKTMAGNLQDLHDVPQTPLIQQFKEATKYLTDAEADVLRRVCHTYAIPICVSPAEAEAETEAEVEEPPHPPKGGRRAPSRFTTPTLEEITQYCNERKNTLNPQLFLDHYTANGWLVGRNPMKDWKAAIRTWERNGFNRNTNGTTSHAKTLDDMTPAEQAEFFRKQKAERDGALNL
jgi:hypothetical protein